MINTRVFYCHVTMFPQPFSIAVVGPSGCGKTTWVKQLILSGHANPEKWYWFYTQRQPQLERELSHKVAFVEGLPDDVDTIIQDRSTSSCVVIDDQMTEAGSSQKVADLFTKHSHHCNTSVILILQNLFFRTKFSRDIHLNCQFLVLFKNPRDVRQIKTLATQMYPGEHEYFMSAYKHATSKPFNPLIIDTRPICDDKYRLSSHIFDKYPTFYVRG